MTFQYLTVSCIYLLQVMYYDISILTVSCIYLMHVMYYHRIFQYLTVSCIYLLKVMYRWRIQGGKGGANAPPFGGE